jgi:acetyltransferase-like isoleucine patch superfamily enzyme
MGWVMRSIMLGVKSILCTICFRLHGFRSPLVICEGQLPALHGGGTVVVRGRLALRGYVARCELGATPGACLEIGKRVFVNQGTSIVASKHIEIGDDSRIGDFVAIYDTNYHPTDSEHATKSLPVVIGANVWLGRNVIVLPGSRVGDHVVATAGSVVSGEIPPRVLISGNPAKVIRKLSIPDGWRRG